AVGSTHKTGSPKPHWPPPPAVAAKARGSFSDATSAPSLGVAAVPKISVQDIVADGSFVVAGRLFCISKERFRAGRVGQSLRRRDVDLRRRIHLHRRQILEPRLRGRCNKAWGQARQARDQTSASPQT